MEKQSFDFSYKSHQMTMKEVRNITLEIKIN